MMVDSEISAASVLRDLEKVNWVDLEPHPGIRISLFLLRLGRIFQS